MEGHTQFVSLDWTLIFQWGNLLILYLIIKKFLFGPIQKMLSDRENEVKSMYDSAEKAEKDAISMKPTKSSKTPTSGQPSKPRRCSGRPR